MYMFVLINAAKKSKGVCLLCSGMGFDRASSAVMIAADAICIKGFGNSAGAKMCAPPKRNHTAMLMLHHMQLFASRANVKIEAAITSMDRDVVSMNLHGFR